MKKLVVAVLIIGTFVLYSLTHQPSNGSALVQVPTVDSGSAASAVTSISSGASGSPPAPSATATTLAGSTSTPTRQPAQSVTNVPSPTPTPAPTIAPTPTTQTGQFKDGTYTGSVADAQWGYIQVSATISQGKITDVQFLQYPSDRSRSVRINQYADPELRSEAIRAQSAEVDIITGATDSSEAFMQSLSDALAQAQG
jgi:uncharacterized protein with FMN-binding domain